MTVANMRNLIVAAALAALSVGGLWRAIWSSGGAPRPAYGRVPDFRLGAAGAPRAVSRKDLLGSPWIAGFVYTSCGGPCPLVTAAMSRLQGELPAQVRLVSFTVDPDRDTPEVLAAYARRFGAKPGRWLFLTGEKAGLHRLLREGFKLPVQEDPGAPSGLRVSHSAKLVLVDGAGAIRGYYDSDDPPALQALARDARGLLR